MDVRAMLERSGIVLDKDSRCVAEKDGLYYIAQFVEKTGALHIYTALDLLPEEPSREMFELLLTANLPAPSGGPGTCAYLKGSGYVIYHMSLDTTTISPDDLEDTIDDFRDKALSLALRMEELMGQKKDVPVSPFDPNNYMPPDMMLFC